MNKIIKYIGILTILPLVLVALTPELIADAYALQKAEGSPGTVSPKSYGSATADIVCGDRLCSTPEGSPDPINIGNAS
jgi:hypothetical protein